jgi:hypothetical protein
MSILYQIAYNKITLFVGNICLMKIVCQIFTLYLIFLPTFGIFSNIYIIFFSVCIEL